MTMLYSAPIDVRKYFSGSIINITRKANVDLELNISSNISDKKKL